MTPVTNTEQTITSEIAVQLLDKGWSPLPLPPRSKSEPPKGFTGYAGKYATASDLAAWNWDGNIALRLPPDVVGVDVDVYKGGADGLTELEDKYGYLPYTIRSTSRDDGSGIALFRVPVGTTLNANPANGIEMIQAHHRYMIVWPSIHPEGRIYQWVDDRSGSGETMDGHDAPIPIDELPDLPWGWIEGLAVTKTGAASAATPDDVRGFIEANTAQTRPGALAGIRSRLNTYQGSRHDTLVETMCWALREAAAGLYAADAAIADIHSWWHRVMDNQLRRDGGEFGSAVMWAVAQVELDSERVAEIKAKESALFSGQMSRPTNVDFETGEITPETLTNLSDEFWNARPKLAHIRQAAHSRLVSADACLLATLARVIMLTSPNIVLPATVGSRVSLNLFVAIVDPSGGGKSASVGAAKDLLPTGRVDIIDPILPSSGEGLIEAYFGMVTEPDPDTGKPVKVKRQTKKAGLAFVDEGQSLLSQADRSGSTIMETIRSAWMGGDIGQHNAAEERKRWLQPHQYRLSMIVGFQLKFAANMIADGEGGTPQRFTFASGTDEGLTDDAEWPGELDFEPQPGSPVLVDVSMDPSIRLGIRERRFGRTRGHIIVNPLDTHADLRKLKLAAALAVLEGRIHINTDDWDLAEMIDVMSCAVRTTAINYDREAQRFARQAATAHAVDRESIMETASLARAIARISLNVARRVWDAGPMTPAIAYRVVSPRDRTKASVYDVVEFCQAKKWLTQDGENLARGERRP